MTLTTPIPDGTDFAFDNIGGVEFSKNLLADFAGADVLGLVTANPAANSVLGRLKAIADAIASGGGSGDATAANQVTGNTTLASILAKLTADPATQTTLAAVLAKLTSDPSTAANQTTANTSLASILAKLTNDPATQTTLAAVLAKLTSDPSTATLQSTGNTTLASILAKLIANPATETTLAAVLAKLAPANLEYETVAANATDQILGTTGAIGDYLSHIVIQPATTSPGTVTVKDGSTVIFTFTTGTLADLSPITVPFGAKSLGVGWKVTTGANVAVTGFGDFT